MQYINQIRYIEYFSISLTNLHFEIFIFYALDFKFQKMTHNTDCNSSLGLSIENSDPGSFGWQKVPNDHRDMWTKGGAFSSAHGPFMREPLRLGKGPHDTRMARYIESTSARLRVHAIPARVSRSLSVSIRREKPRDAGSNFRISFAYRRMIAAREANFSHCRGNNTLDLFLFPRLLGRERNDPQHFLLRSETFFSVG